MALHKYVPESSSTNKGYATPDNAVKAAEKKFGATNLRYLVMVGDNGRYFPVFIGQEAMRHGVHFTFHFVG